jgi:hypothetical protein
MVIFTEVMKDMVLQSKVPTEVVITEEQILIRFSPEKVEVCPVKKLATSPLKTVCKKLFKYNGESLTASEWAERYNVPVRVIYQRFRANGTPETLRHSRADKKTSKK